MTFCYPAGVAVYFAPIYFARGGGLNTLVTSVPQGKLHEKFVYFAPLIISRKFGIKTNLSKETKLSILKII